LPGSQHFGAPPKEGGRLKARKQAPIFSDDVDDDQVDGEDEVTPKASRTVVDLDEDDAAIEVSEVEDEPISMAGRLKKRRVVQGSDSDD
jgi:hypothetical protein